MMSWVSVYVVDRHNTVLYSRFITALTVCTLPPLPLVTFFFQSHGKLVPWGHGTIKGTG